MPATFQAGGDGTTPRFPTGLSRVGLHLFATQHIGTVNVGLEQHQPTRLQP